MVCFWRCDSPVGTYTVAEDGMGICSLFFGERLVPPDWEMRQTPLLKTAILQLAEYFSGKRQTFDLPLSLHGTPFQLADWAALQTIPYGETCCYQQIAEQMGNPKACRAVGLANNRNPVAVIVPCHRVVGKNGGLVGYAGGVWRKKAYWSWNKNIDCPNKKAAFLSEF